MLNETIKDKLRSIYQAMDKVLLPGKGDGWVSMFDFQREVRKARINFKNLGYEWFNEFLNDSELFFIWTDFSGEKPTRYVIEKTKPISYEEQRRPQYNRVATQYVDSEEVVKIKRRLRLENNLFIGQFAPQKNEGWFTITDLRNTDFTKIEDKERGVKNLSISFRSNKEFNRYAYYKFTWVLLETDPLKFGIDLHEEISPVYPKDIVSSLYEVSY